MREAAARNGKKRARFTSFCPIFEVLTIKQKERSERFITLTCSFNGANGRTRTGDLRVALPPEPRWLVLLKRLRMSRARNHEQ